MLRGWRAEDRNRDRLAAPACVAGQKTGRQDARRAECCHRDARRERESVFRSFAMCFTGEALHSLSECLPLGVTRMRFPQPFPRKSANSEPLEPARRRLSRETRQAFFLAEAARTLRRGGSLFRTFPSRTPSREGL